MKVHAIINPSAAGNRACLVEDALRRVLGEHLKSVHVSTYRGDATYVARQAATAGADVVIAAGGDGTIHDICNGIVGHNVVLGIIPCGTANDLAVSLNIPSDIGKACKSILTGSTRRIDLLRVNDRYFVTTGGLGMSAHALAAADCIRRYVPGGVSLGRLLGTRLYMFGLACALANPRMWHHPVTIHIDDRAWEADAFSLTVGNLKTLGGRFHLAPEAISNDGLLHVCLLNNYRSVSSMLRTVARTTTGTHVELDNVNTLKCSRLRIESSTPLTWFADGEIVGTDRTFVVEILPRAIEVIVPLQENEVSHVA